jgi:sensor histidine kinase regulating citrate/malate metabolism
VVDGLPVTTKTDKENHGYGLKSIKNIVELNDGVLGFSVNDDVFEIKIIFPYREPVLAK